MTVKELLEMIKELEIPEDCPVEFSLKWTFEVYAVGRRQEDWKPKALFIELVQQGQNDVNF